MHHVSLLAGLSPPLSTLAVRAVQPTTIPERDREFVVPQSRARDDAFAASSRRT